MKIGLIKLMKDENIFIKYLLKEFKLNKESFVQQGELHNKIRKAVIANTDNNPQFEIIKNSGKKVENSCFKTKGIDNEDYKFYFNRWFFVLIEQH